MSKANFMLRIPGCDITDVDGCRNKLIDVFNDPEFETFVRGLDTTLAAAGAAPAPRGGEISAGCHAENGGNWGCHAEGTWHF